jgi:hypothetical protein
MFKRSHHNTVDRILQSLDADFLFKNQCYFGGGTRIVMELDEYRDSLDIDLLCASTDGYRNIRSQITEHSLGSILAKPLPLAREVRADRYGIRTFFQVDELKVKFEIVAEGRISLSSVLLPLVPLHCLDRTSCFAEKLLANADRWADKSVCSRDIIDIAFMIGHWGPIPSAAYTTAEFAYGNCIYTSLQNALTLLLSDESYLERCITTMDIDDVPRLKTSLKMIDVRNAQ